ncbi:serine/threonine-protein kinase [Corynebacterium jeikeium]|jgi:serine/threonine protein kinase|uniref:serine/threonine-protein kinase n=2 Tax=Corynebacterium jeikeium TaxID=38289 RepID=UPI0001B71640|nr:serine/threonine-protein kinase [Corynebacterium jeikeium]EEW15548.1 kinase domain protein [Corynebacterium jeikeium ATCC 43734]OOD31144.1 serine/threonine protein kinase [Corynebacterium jeikeium]WCZ52592.1 Serine/threonine-protein kinase PknA [Corynebacterium jeikeium]SQI18773.1 serine/threonine protein kinase PknA [Corynebacterium jeikeium]SUY82102.1 serine/threonine protein kinase PknA [Corynebacterium jeikeium]
MSDSRQPDRTEIERTQRLLGERFELQWIIGRGGMSTVWLAHDVEQQRDVAVKILKPEYTENEEFRARFRNEASAAQDLDSPNVVRTYDSGEVEDPDNGTVFCYIIMEYIRGESLADVLSRESSLPQNLALDVLTQTAAGLKAIHEAGLVHRDIKPGNLLITSDGFVKITDFGIAKAAAAVPLTRTGMVVGTAQYVSPEQAQGDQVGPASDVYSLGVVGFEMLAGYRPFSGESTVSVAIKHISETPPELPEEIDPNLRELIRVCLRKSPRTRYADGAELATATVMVAEGKQPPSPHNVPNVSAEPHPLTEQLGNVASGPGTRVPSVPGPQYGPGSGARPGQGPGYPDSSVPVVGAGAPPTGAGYPATGRGAGGAQGASPKKNRWIIAVLALVSILALALATFLLTSGGDDEAPNPSTMTVTNEVTTSPTEEGEPANPSGNVPAPVNPSPTDTTNGPSTTSKTETSREETETSEEREPSFPTLPTIPNGGGRGNGNVNGENGTARQTEPNQPHTNDNATSEDSDMPAELRSPSTNPESQPVL